MGNRYKNEESTTYDDTLKNYGTSFGSGDLKGAVSVDTFWVEDLEIKNTEFVEVTD